MDTRHPETLSKTAIESFDVYILAALPGVPASALRTSHEISQINPTIFQIFAVAVTTTTMENHTTDTPVIRETTVVIRDTSPLVSVQDLHFVKFIPKRDKIVIGRVKGFQLVVSRDLFGEGSGEEKESGGTTLNSPVKVVYCEADTVLDPMHPLFALLKNKTDGLCRTVEESKYGIRSCGAAFPLSVLRFYKIDPATIEPNEDLTLRVFARKYIKPTDELVFRPPKDAVGDDTTTKFPKDIVPKTDEPRINADEKLWAEAFSRVAAGEIPVITLKLDGTSMTVTGEAQPRVCGRNFVLNRADNKANAHYFQAVDALGVCQKLAKTGIALQGEVMGPKIQNNCLGLEKVTWYVFNGYRDGKYIPHAELERLCKDWGFPMVPRVKIDPEDLPKTLEDWEKLATAQVYPGGGEENPNPAEGIVVKFDGEKLPRLSFKVLSTRYKLEGVGVGTARKKNPARKRKPAA